MSSRRTPDPNALRVFVIAAVISVTVLAFAYYLQHVKLLDPCPWCVAQRILYMAIALVAFTGLVHRPSVKGAKLYGVAGGFFALLGAAAAAYQLSIQGDPLRSSSCMGSWLEKTLDALQI